MCRLLTIRDQTPFSIAEELKKFATIAKNSKEYQGHGWGCSYRNQDGEWHHYKNIKPMWEDNLEQFGETTILIAHARSAFEDRGIVVENNMPFYDEKFIYIFNGELRGVKIREEGRIGAEKIFNFIKRFNEGNATRMLNKGTEMIGKRTKYVRAMNIILTEADTDKIVVTNIYNEDEDYFQMWYKILGKRIAICSNKFPGEEDWEKISTSRVSTF
jgi:predicted glutamine amidotransferase